MFAVLNVLGSMLMLFSVTYLLPIVTSLSYRDGMLVDDEVDADMLESADEYDNEGQDFAVSFSGPPAAASGSVGGTIG